MTSEIVYNTIKKKYKFIDTFDLQGILWRKMKEENYHVC